MNILQKNPRIKATLKYLIVLVLVLLVSIFQDLWSSSGEDFSDYYQDSVLPKIFWVLIFPVGFFLSSIFRRVSLLGKIRNLLVRRMLFVVIASLLHILLFAVLLNLVSVYFYEHTFTFNRNLEFAISHDLYKYLLIYSVIALLLVRKKNVNRT